MFNSFVMCTSCGANEDYAVDQSQSVLLQVKDVGVCVEAREDVGWAILSLPTLHVVTKGKSWCEVVF